VAAAPKLTARSGNIDTMTRRPPTSRTCRLAAAVVVAGAILAACTVNAAPAPTSMVPLIDPADLPITTLAPTTTAAPVTGPVDPLLAALPDTACAYADAPAGGEITFISGDRLYGTTADTTLTRCLLQIESFQRGTVKWSPVANRAVLAQATVFDVNGTRQSGYDPFNGRIQWEYPVGDSLIAPNSSSYSLVRRSATDPGNRSDPTFLGLTVAAVSHPSGQLLIGAGLTRDRVEGVFAADLQGDDLRPLALAGGDLTFLELVAEPTGRSVLVLSSRGDAVRLHRIELASLMISEIVSQPTPMQLVTPSPAGDLVAWRAGLCNSMTQTVLGGGTSSPTPIGQGTPLQTRSVSPIGWLDAGRLVLAARTFGCDGPAEVWVWNLADSSATLLVRSVEHPAVRVVQPQGPPVTIDPGAQPGAL
jgi:hypothetical protein